MITDTDGFCNQIGLKIDHIMSPYNRDTKKKQKKTDNFRKILENYKRKAKDSLNVHR